MDTPEAGGSAARPKTYLSSNGERRDTAGEPRMKQDADYIFHDLTRSICPECKAVIDAQIIIRDDKVFMRKRCPHHG